MSKDANIMKWKITNESTRDEDVDPFTIKRYTSQTKQLTITIGDIVGMGKNALGAVKSINDSLPAFLEEYPDANLGPISGVLGLLSTLVTGLDIYKGVMKAVEIATPIVQLAALISGIWASPANAGEMVQVILGQAEKALIALAVSALIKLKDWVWSYEFVLKEINTEWYDLIEKNIKQTQEELKKILDESLDQGDPNLNLDNGNAEIDLSNSINWDETKSDSYITELNVEYEKKDGDEIKTISTKRMLRGSLIDGGIEFTDDDGRTWKQTKQLDGSWKDFAKIFNNGKYVYVSGGIDYITSIVPTSDEEIQENKNYYYFDSNRKIKEYSYNQKKELKVEDAKEPLENYGITKSQGIAYSEDNGITWKISDFEFPNESVNDLCEFEEKDGSIATITESSNNYHGTYYTTDGINWNPSSENTGKWIDIESYENDKKFIVIENIKQKMNTSSTKILIGKKIEFENLNVNYNMDNCEIEIKE